MSFKNASSIYLLVFSAIALQAQAPPTPAARPAPTVVAGIPVNYDEAKVGTYTLPDPLKLNNGKPVRDAKTWYAKRRPEIVEMFETQQYGRAPGRPADESFEVVDKGTPALNGKAIRKQVTIYFSKDNSWPADQPADLSAGGGEETGADVFQHQLRRGVRTQWTIPELRRTRCGTRRQTRRFQPRRAAGSGGSNVEPLLDAGIGVATFYYGDVDPDYLNGFSQRHSCALSQAGADGTRA